MISYIAKKVKPLGIILLIIVVLCFISPVTVDACKWVINVVTNLEEATFTINGSISLSGSGTSSSFTPTSRGTYVIVYGYVEGYITPPSESDFIPADNYVVTFEGIYERIKVKGNIIVGAGPGPQNQALVRVLDNEGVFTGLEFIANQYKYGVNVAAGDIDGDGIDEIITGAGPGPQNPAEVHVFDRDGNKLTGLSLTAYDYKYGVNVVSADFDGDGIDEIITGAGPGSQNPAEVKVFVYDSSEMTFIDSGIDLLAYDSKYGVRVAAGDVDGDGIPEIITERGPGPSSVWDVKKWKVDTSSGEAGQWSASLLQ